MNKYVEDYIAKRKHEIENEKKKEIKRLCTQLQIGEKEYHRDFPDEDYQEFPGHDNGYYRYNAGEVSDEEYAAILTYAPKQVKKEIGTVSMSGWYYFSIIMMILGSIGGIIVGMEEGKGVIGIACVLGVFVFFSQIIMLCKIEHAIKEKKI